MFSFIFGVDSWLDIKSIFFLFGGMKQKWKCRDDLSTISVSEKKSLSLLKCSDLFRSLIKFSFWISTAVVSFRCPLTQFKSYQLNVETKQINNRFINEARWIKKQTENEYSLKSSQQYIQILSATINLFPWELSFILHHLFHLSRSPRVYFLLNQ